MDNMDSMSDEPSFVILGTGSIPTSINVVEPSSHSAFTQESLKWNSHSSLEVQQRLDLLLHENRELRDALNQNNLAMKTQFETLAQWQQEVLQTHHSHKEKFAETRELVLKLKAENAALKSDEQNINHSEATIQRIKQLENEKLILVKERDSFREECTRLTLKISDLENTIRKKSEEITILKGNYESLSYMPNSDINGSRGDSQAVPPPYCAIPKVATEYGGPESTQRFAVRPEERFIEMNEPSASGESAEPGQRLESMVSWLCVDDAHSLETKSLRGVVTQLETLEGLLQDEKLRGDSLQKSCDELQQQYDTISEEKKSLEETFRRNDEEAIKLQKELTVKDGMLNSAISELRQEREKIKQLQLQCEGVAVLQAQVEVYQSDYKEEREAREKIVGEKEKLAEEVRLLKAQLAQLEGQIASANRPNLEDAATANPSVCCTQPVEAEVSARVEDAAVVPQMDEQGNRPFACPLCHFRFARLEDCQVHANACLDIAMPPC